MFVMAPNQDTGKSFDDIIQKRKFTNFSAPVSLIG